MSDLQVSGSVNLREVLAGTGLIRGGVFYRSGSLAGLTEAGVRAFAELGIRQVIDLRDDSEVARDPSRLPSGVTVQRTPLFLGSTDSFFIHDVSLAGLYRGMLLESGPRIVQAIGGIAAQRPALVHCSAGKDRTGVTVALTLAAVGIDDEVIVADYASSEQLLPAERNARVLAYLRKTHPDARHVEDLATRSPAPVMRALLASVRHEYGSAAEYLSAHGFAEAQLHALRVALLPQ